MYKRIGFALIGLLTVSGCLLFSQSPRQSQSPTQSATEVSTQGSVPTRIETQSTVATSQAEIVPLSLSEVLPDGVTYEVLDDQYTEITSGLPVRDDRIFGKAIIFGDSISFVDVGTSYVERVKNIRVTNGIESADLIIFTVRNFFEDGSSATVTYSTTQNMLKASAANLTLKPGEPALIRILSPHKSDLLPKLRELVIQGFKITDFEVDLVISDKFQLLSPSEIEKALDNVRKTGEIDLSFRVLIYQAIQIPGMPTPQ